MKLRNRRLIFCVAFVVAGMIRIWLATLRYRIVYGGGIVHPAPPEQGRYLYAVWHEALLVPMIARARASLLISQHADGELVAQVCRFLGYGAVRGSSTRGGSQALLEMKTAGRERHLLVTPDGPRGPRREVQKGLVYLASRSGLPIVFIAAGFSRAWRARSWDQFAVPRPFSTVFAVLSPPIAIPADIDRPSQVILCERMRGYFGELTASAEEWAAGGPEPRPVPLERKLLEQRSA